MRRVTHLKGRSNSMTAGRSGGAEEAAEKAANVAEKGADAPDETTDTGEKTGEIEHECLQSDCAGAVTLLLDQLGHVL
jgi:hypothetical protein